MVVIVAVWNQIGPGTACSFLAGLGAAPGAWISRQPRSTRRAADAAVLDHHLPRWPTTKTTFFLIIVNITYVFFNTLGIIDTATGRRPQRRDAQTLVYKVFQDGKAGADPRRLGGAVGDLDGDRGPAHPHSSFATSKEGSLLNAMIRTSPIWKPVTARCF